MIAKIPFQRVHNSSKALKATKVKSRANTKLDYIHKSFDKAVIPGIVYASVQSSENNATQEEKTIINDENEKEELNEYEQQELTKKKYEGCIQDLEKEWHFRTHGMKPD